MSSMWRTASILPVLLALAPSSSAQYAAPYANASAQYSAVNVGYSLDDWRRLRQSSGYSFADYARLLIPNRGWPEESKLRTWAEKAMRPGENAATVIAFFAANKPTTGNGWARLAEAYSAGGNSTSAAEAARGAWASPDLSADDEQAIWTRYNDSFTRADFDHRVDALLFAKKPQDAARFLNSTSPRRQASFAARMAMQTNATDADSKYQAVVGAVTSDAGLMMDRARWLRANNYENAAEQLAARSHDFTDRPADPERLYDMLLSLANDAVQDRNWETAYNIARQVDDVLPEGAIINDQPIALRDNYTSLVWLGGTVALDRMQRPGSAVAMFDRYARAGKSLRCRPRAIIGPVALRSPPAARSPPAITSSKPAPIRSYSMASLRSNSSVVRLRRRQPPYPQYVTTAAQRTAFNASPCPSGETARPARSVGGTSIVCEGTRSVT